MDTLTAHWLGGETQAREQIQAAFAAINRRLEEDPLNEGESREGNIRIAFVPPFVVDFNVDPENRLVSVLYVRFIKSKR